MDDEDANKKEKMRILCQTLRSWLMSSRCRMQAAMNTNTSFERNVLKGLKIYSGKSIRKLKVA